MAHDYSPRRTIYKNRPKKQPIGLLLPVVACAIVISFSGGLFTGWLLFYKKNAALPEQVAVQQPSPTPQAATASRTSAPGNQSLTFYETLSKGGNNTALIGSGINPVVPVQPVEHKPASPTSPAPVAAEKSPVKVPVLPTAPEKQTATPAAPPVPAQAKVPGKVPVTSAESGKAVETSKPSKETFVVQVGSYKNRAEAEEMVTRSRGVGLPAYIVEAKTDKGTWYRVRAGKKLDQETANKLAAKAGKGAITVPE